MGVRFLDVEQINNLVHSSLLFTSLDHDHKRSLQMIAGL